MGLEEKGKDKERMRLSPSAPLRERLAWDACSGRQLTPDEVRSVFGPPETLGVPRGSDTYMALDSQMVDTGCYSLLQHSLEMGVYGSMASFMGYGALQNIAQNGLIRACVETVADDMTRAWVELARDGEKEEEDEGREEETGKDADDKRIDAMTREIKRLKLKDVFHQAASLTGYYGGCLLYLDTGDDTDLELPLNLDTSISSETRHRGFLKSVRVIDPVNIFPGNYNSSDPLRKDYYLPRFWWVLGRKVHSTRLIRVVDNEPPILFRPAYNFLGIPQAQILWDYVSHFQQNRDSANRLMQKFSTLVFKTSLTDILTGNANDLSSLDARMQILARNRSNDGVFAIDKDSEDVVKVETPMSGVSDVVRQSLEILAALNRTPAVKLLGISPSGFNATGESDIRNYYDHVLSQQEKVLRAPLEKVLNVLQTSLFGDVDRTVTFDFCKLSEDDQMSAAMTQQTKIGNLCQLLDRDVISPEEARAALVADPDSGFDNLDPDAVPEQEGDGDEGGMPPGMPGAMEGTSDEDASDAPAEPTPGKDMEMSDGDEEGEIASGDKG